MARNAELIRQWEILREIDGARTGIAIAKLASLRAVHPRTIRRDLEALCKAGFPLYDERVNGTAMWKLRARPFGRLEETGLSVAELCALYFGRTMVAALTGAPFTEDVERAMMKVERALPLAARKVLDQLPGILKTKVTGRKKHDARRTREIVARATDASLTHRRVQMRYHSSSSRRTKDYTIDPLRVAYANGGLYLTAYVGEYAETRTFAIERIRTLALLDEHFEPRPLAREPFANSLGVYSGSPEVVEIAFDVSAADYVKEREWHPSQALVELGDGSVLLRLCVCNDRDLRRWILGFGAAARVLTPAALVRDIAQDLAAAQQHYLPRFRFEMLKMDAQAGDARGADNRPRGRPESPGHARSSA